MCTKDVYAILFPETKNPGNTSNNQQTIIANYINSE